MSQFNHGSNSIVAIVASALVLIAFAYWRGIPADTKYNTSIVHKIIRLVCARVTIIIGRLLAVMLNHCINIGLLYRPRYFTLLCMKLSGYTGLYTQEELI